MSCNLTDAEWKLMHRLWEQSPQTITQLTAALSAETGWEKHTVITMLTRLEAKGAVRHEAGGRAKQFYPAVAQSDAAWIGRIGLDVQNNVCTFTTESNDTGRSRTGSVTLRFIDGWGDSYVSTLTVTQKP